MRILSLSFRGPPRRRGEGFARIFRMTCGRGFRIDNTVLHYLGIVLVAFSILQAAPLVVSVVFNETVRFPMRIYVVPALIAWVAGLALVTVFRPRRLTPGSAMAIGALGWFALSLVGAIPFWLALDITYLDAFFEATSGFTTTGATVLRGLALLPKSLLLWRALSEWIGGLGIFTLFLFVIRESGGVRHTLLGVEAHKAASERFSPGVFHSLRILWTIYLGLTVTCGLILWSEGLSPFDAATHAMTTLATGGFSNYDESIGHFARSGYPFAIGIEYTILVFMFFGGTSFLVHWHLLRRRWSAVRRNSELKAWIALLIVATVVIAVADRDRAASIGFHEHVRTCLFHVVSITTTTGFTTTEFGGLSPLTRQIFLVLMLFGGCIGSTAGGLKILRGILLGKLLRRRIRVLSRSHLEVVPVTLNRGLLERSEIDRTVAIAIAWAGALGVTWILGTAFSSLNGWESLSAAISAVSNIGPNYVDPEKFVQLSAGTKVIYILAMVAGRLEVIPFLLIFSRRMWK